MKKIGFIVAMQKELELFAQNLQNFETKQEKSTTFYCGLLSGFEIIAAVSGIGKVNASLCAAELINKFNPDILVNIGISGGLDSSLNIGDFVIGSDIVYHDVWCGEPNTYGQIQGLPALFHSDTSLAQKLPYQKGLICCGDKFITEKTELEAIKQKFPTALAVDMESAALAQTCHIFQTPFISIRQISDTPGEHQAEQYSAFWANAAQNSFNLIENILGCL